MLLRFCSIVSIAFCLLLTACGSSTSVDLVVHHALVYTVDSAFSNAEAFAVHEGKIVAVGTNANIQQKYTGKQTIDAQGKPIYPGFIDAHAHFVRYGQALFQVDLFGTTSWNEVVQRVKKFADEHPNEPWVLGRGWDQNDWADKAFPTNEQLNTLFPNRPVLLERVDGHATVANQKALDIAGVVPGQTLTGGQIQTKNGKLTGVLVDNATNLVESKIAKPSMDDYVKWLGAAQNNCFAVGLTTVTDCGLMYTDVQTINGLQNEGKLSMRMYVMLSDHPDNYQQFLEEGPLKTDRLTVGGFKVYADGALGSRGACLLQPYTDQPGWSGFLLRNTSHYDSVAQVLAKTNFQMCTHAIGDSANRMVLNIYNKVLGGKNDKRWRIEHAQVVNENDFGLFGSASVVPSVQPTHGTSDMYWAENRLGPVRVKGAYAYKQLLQQNGWLPLGTDFPVEDISPFKTFLAAAIRKDGKGFPANGFQMENALTREETLKGMTIWAAKAGFQEKEIGSIEVGKKADFIMLDGDLMQVPDNQILTTKVLATYIGGVRVYGK